MPIRGISRSASSGKALESTLVASGLSLSAARQLASGAVVTSSTDRKKLASLLANLMKRGRVADNGLLADKSS